MNLSRLWSCGLAWMLIQVNTDGSDANISDKDLEQFAKSHTEFALDLYKRAALKDSNKNIFLSPLSISFALGLVHLGARENSAKQINNALHFDARLTEQFHPIQNRLFNLLNSDQSYSLYIVNKLYGDQTLNVLQQFLVASKQYYGSEMEKVDFKNNADGIRHSINQWVSKNTDGKITDLIAPGVLNEKTKMVVANAIYFKGQWLYKFDQKSTQKGYFHVSDREVIEVQFMRHINKKMNHSVSHRLHAHVLELPFAQNVVLHVVLPYRGTSLKEVENLLASDVLGSLVFYEKPVNVWIPRFELKLDFDLKNHLKELGVVDIFDEELADLSGINGTKDLFVSDALHKAFIKLDEEGVKAAAATSFVVRRARYKKVQEMAINFKADRPFFFYLKERRSNVIFFLGKFSKP